MRHQAVLAAVLAASGAAHADPLGDAIKKVEAPIAVTNGKLDGKGADVLRPAIDAANFIALGEDHGIAQIPAFAAALCTELAPHGLHRVALEVGPSVAPHLEAFARASDGAAQLAAFDARYPESVAFYDWREESEFLRSCAKAMAPATPLQIWGVDQELMGATGLVLDDILATRPGTAGTAAIQKLAKAAADARAEAAKTGNYEGLFLMSGKPAAFDAAKAALAKDGSAEARGKLDALLASRDIYLGQSGPTPYLSNRARARLMKETFLDDIGLGVKEDKAFPKVLVKLGAYHLYRGMNPLHSTELGNLINEAAEGHRVESSNILILGVKGDQLRPQGVGKPAAPGAFDLTKDPDFAFLAPFLAALPAGSASWTLFDLRALRPSFRKLGKVDPEAERMIFGYDFLVLVPDAKASHP